MSSTNPQPETIVTTLGGVALNTAYPPIDKPEGQHLVITDDASGKPQEYVNRHLTATTALWMPVGGAFSFLQPYGLTGAQSTTAVVGAPAIKWAGRLGKDNLVAGFGIKLHAMLANADAGTTTSILLRNNTTSTLVAIGGVGVTVLSSVGTTLTEVVSVDLVTGGAAGAPAAGFRVDQNDIYTLELYTSNAANAASLGGAMVQRTIS